MAEDRKNVGPEAPPKAGKTRSSGPLEISVSATLQMPSAPDTASLSGYVSWLELQYQEAERQLATVHATNVPAGYTHSATAQSHLLTVPSWPGVSPTWRQYTSGVSVCASCTQQQSSNQSSSWCLPGLEWHVLSASWQLCRIYGRDGRLCCWSGKH